MRRFSAWLVASLLLAAAFTEAFALSGQHRKVTLRVDGLACPFCAYGLEKKLKRVEGIDKLDIKLNDGLVILYFKEDAKIDKALLEKKVKEAGFTLRKITIEGQAPPVTNGKAIQKAREISLQIKGMACDSCVSRVQKALSEFDCVSDVSVDAKAGVATLACSDDKMDEQKLVKAVEKLGFKAKVIRGERKERQ